MKRKKKKKRKKSQSSIIVSSFAFQNMFEILFFRFKKKFEPL